MNSGTAPLQGGDFGRMIYVPSRGEGDGEIDRGKRQLSGPGAANRRRIISRNRPKVVERLQNSRGRRLFSPVLVLEFFAQETASLACVSGHVLLLTEVFCDVRLVEREAEENDAIAEAGKRDA